MYLHLSKQKQKYIIQVNYELGYLFGLLISKRYVINLRGEEPKIRMLYHSSVFQVLEDLDLNRLYISEKPDGVFIIISGELFDLVYELIRYTQTKLLKDDLFFQSKECATGFCDFFKERITITINKNLSNVIEKLMWYWFERKIEIQNVVKNNRLVYLFKI